ncbi:MAG: GNAT family N-acetyltransferase [Sulfitobacter sp. SK025]|nr:MAG: GNAT family N-acetyltransferase [Sulfitobacter sp. SK025]
MARQACLDDLDAITPLFDAYRVFYGQASDPGKARSFLIDRFVNQQSIVFVSEISEKAVGFTQLYPSYSSVHCARILVLNDLFVSPDARGRGVAQDLLKTATKYAERIGAIRLTLITANGNAVAQSLYEKCGWNRDTAFRTYHLAVG